MPKLYDVVITGAGPVGIPTVVFTTTLVNIVVALTDMIATRSYTVPKDTKRRFASFMLYFLGALCAGFCIFLHLEVLVGLPFIAVSVAFAIELRRRE